MLCVLYTWECLWCVRWTTLQKVRCLWCTGEGVSAEYHITHQGPASRASGLPAAARGADGEGNAAQGPP